METEARRAAPPSVAVVDKGGGLRVSGRFVSRLAKQRDGRWQLVHQRYENIEPRPSRSGTEDDGSLSAADKVAIMDVIYRAGRTVDSRDPEGRADCYVDDAVYEYEGGERTVGREAFIRKLRDAADPQRLVALDHQPHHRRHEHASEGAHVLRCPTTRKR